MRKRNRIFYSIRFKVLLVFFVVTFVTMFGGFSFFRQYAYQASMERYQEQLVPLRNSLKNNLSTYISTCVQAVRSVYYNDSTVRLITNPHTNFSNTETEDSKTLFSFLLSVYASLPSSRQIHLSAYKLDRSFLITTRDLVRYLDVRPGYSFASDYPDRYPSDMQKSIWVEGSHPIHSYDHFLSPYARMDGHVFTVHVPIYMMPDYTNVIGLISVDIETSYIDENCGYINDMGAEVYISDQDGRLIYARDAGLIGQPVESVSGLTSIWKSDNETWEDSYISTNSLITTNVIDTSYCKWQISTITPIGRITHDFTGLQIRLIMMFCACLLVLALIMALVMMRYTRPLNQIAMFMHGNFYKKNYNLTARLSDHIRYRSKDEISVLVENIDAMLDTVNRFVVREYQLLLARRTADLRTLQAQINPHFIYNTLQCIASKTLEKGDVESYDYIASFGQLLQYAMDVDESMVTLSQEVDHMRRYLALQSIRYECDILCAADIPPEYLGMMLPKMSLQPLAENSLLHGRLYAKENGYVSLRVFPEDEMLVIEIADNGQSISTAQQAHQQEKILKLRRQYQYLKNASVEDFDADNLLMADGEPELLEQTVEAHHGAHIGATNVFTRFLLHFGSRCEFAMESNEAGGTSVRIYLPKDRIHFKNHNSERSVDA